MRGGLRTGSPPRLQRGSNEAAGVHCNSGRRADRITVSDERTAARADAPDRHAHEPDCGRSGSTNTHRKGYRNWVGSPVGTCGSTSVGVETPKVIAKVRRSLPRPHLTSSWRPPDPALAAAQQVTCTVPIVLVNMIDPVGYVKSLSRPGGNITGFTLYEYSSAGHKCNRAKHG